MEGTYVQHVLQLTNYLSNYESYNESRSRRCQRVRHSACDHMSLCVTQAVGMSSATELKLWHEHFSLNAVKFGLSTYRSRSNRNAEVSLSSLVPRIVYERKALFCNTPTTSQHHQERPSRHAHKGCHCNARSPSQCGLHCLGHPALLVLEGAGLSLIHSGSHRVTSCVYLSRNC